MKIFSYVLREDFPKAGCDQSGERRLGFCVVYGSSAVKSAHGLMPAHAGPNPSSGSPSAECAPGISCSVESFHKASV